MPSRLPSPTCSALQPPRGPMSLPEPTLSRRSASTSSHRPKVLVVDDDDGMAFLIHHALHQDNRRFDVLLARSVEVALEILADVAVEVIVTDVELPDRSGMDLLSWAALERPDTRVIIMTGHDVGSIRDRAHACGCIRLMSKPFDLQEMRRTIL